MNKDRTLSESIAVLNKRLKRASLALSGKGVFLSNVRQATKMLYGDKDSIKFKIPKGSSLEERKKIEEVVTSLLENPYSTAKGRKKMVQERLAPQLLETFGQLSEKNVSKLLKIFDSEHWDRIREIAGVGASETIVDEVIDAIESGTSLKDIKNVIKDYDLMTGEKEDFMSYFTKHI